MYIHKETVMKVQLSTKNDFIVSDRLIREDERRFITSISRAQAYELEKKGLFPARIKIGLRSVAWRLSEIITWVEKRSNE